MKGPYLAFGLLDASSAGVFHQPCPDWWEGLPHSSLRYTTNSYFPKCTLRSSNASSTLDGRKRRSDLRKSYRVPRLLKPSFPKRHVECLFRSEEPWKSCETENIDGVRFPDSLATSPVVAERMDTTRGAICRNTPGIQLDLIEALGSIFSRKVHVELVAKILNDSFKKTRFRDTDVWLRASSDCCSPTKGTPKLFFRVLGRFLLSFIFLLALSLVPYRRFSRYAYAASPVDTAPRHEEHSEVKSKDLYEGFVEERLKMEQESGGKVKLRHTGKLAAALEEKILSLRRRIHDQMKSHEEVKHKDENLRSDEEIGWEEKGKFLLSPNEEKLFGIIEKRLEALKGRIDKRLKIHGEKAERFEIDQRDRMTDSVEDKEGSEEASVYEEKLQRKFEERFQTLQSLGKEPRRKADKKVSLLEKAEKELENIMVEGRKLQGKALVDMEAAVAQFKKEEAYLARQLEKVVDKYLKAIEDLKKIAGDGRQADTGLDTRLAKEKDVQNAEAEFADLWDRLMMVEVNILLKQVGNLKVALHKVPGLEQQIKEAITRFSTEDPILSSATESQEKVRRETLAGDLKRSYEKFWEQRFLPLSVDVQEGAQKVDEKTRKFLESIRNEEKKSMELQDSIDNIIKEDLQVELKTIFPVQHSTESGALKDFPADELLLPSKGSKEQSLDAASLNVASRWKRWREEKMAEFKQYLLDKPEIANQYIANQQEQILLARDRVIARTFFDERQKRWVMPPEAAGYAVWKQLVERARIRHDRVVMYVTLKGDSREFYVNIQVLDAMFEEYGGFNSLYLKMILSEIPTTVETMWIPFSEWEPGRLFLLPFKMLYRAISTILQSRLLAPIQGWYLKSLSRTLEELLVRIAFPLLEKLPQQAKLALGLQLADNVPPPEAPPFLMEWRAKVQKNVESRYDENESSTAWWISLPVRCFIVWLPLAFISKQVAKILRPLLGLEEELNEVEWKEKKEEELMKKINAESPKNTLDPIKQAFDRMKRIKQPEVRLENFAGLDTVRDEINEIVTFLRNPMVFKEMGARPPRGVLITGQPGTGKTALAMAIAAEARVPVVELQGLELEGGSWVGQGASNVRDLFKTAREMAPLIIFVDDFDFFTGIRGESGDTRKQEHESLINQFLVELDGFETQEGVVLLATTSRPENIDEALRRPGRMDRTIELPMPNKKERETILYLAAQLTMEKSFIEMVDWKEVARKTEGMTPQQLKLVPQALEATFVRGKHTDDEELLSIYGWLVTFNEAAPEWLKKSKWIRTWKEGLIDWLGLRVTKIDIESSVNCLDVFGESKPGLELYNPSYSWTRNFKFPHAVWAAGRGLVCLLLPNFDFVEQLWLDRTSWEGIAFTKFTKRMEGGYEETSTITRSYYEKQLVLCFGSYVAAHLLLPYGENNNLSRFEIQEAHEIATSMVLDYGWGPNDSQVIYKAVTEDTTMSMGDILEVELNSEIELLFYAAFDKATNMLQKNREVLEALVEHLLQYDIVARKDIARILKEKGAIMEEEPFMLVPYNNSALKGVSTNGTGRPSRALPAGSLA